MSFRTLCILLLLSLTIPLFAEEENTQPDQPRPGMFQRMIHVFHKGKDKDASADQEGGKKKSKTLNLTMEVSPDPLKLSESHQIQVTLRLTNNTPKMVQLNFPTTQRIEVLLRNATGKMVTQWSENQSFDNDAGYVTINPREHVEYSVSISGRDLVAGKPFTIEGFLPNYENLKVSKTIVPQR